MAASPVPARLESVASSSTAAPIAAPSPHPLRLWSFRRLWLGSAVSLAGDQFYLVALPWVVLQMTGSAVAMGTMLMTAAIPRAVLMLMGGVATDRISPRRILMGTAGARALVVGCVGVLLALDILRIWHLYVLGFAFGVADAFSMPASSAFMPSLVARDQLVRANSTMQTTTQLTTIVGPAPAGIAIKAVGAAWAFIIDAVSFLFIVAALWTLPDPPRAAGAVRPSVRQSLADAFTYLSRDSALMSLMTLAAMLNICLSGPMSVGLAYLTKTKFGSPTAYGIAVSALAAGGLGGALLAGIWKVRRRGWLLLGASATIAVCLATIGFLNGLPAIAMVLATMAVAAGVTNIHVASWIQGRVDPAMRGRVLSALMLSAVGLMPFSMAGAGFLAAWSLRGMFLVASAAMLAVVLAAAARSSVRQIQ